MIDYLTAREIAEAEISKSTFAVLLDEHTKEKPYAWIFSYQSKKYIDTGNISYAFAGNSPLFVSQINGTFVRYSSRFGIDEMIDIYEEKNKIWNLQLITDIYSNTQKLHQFKELTGSSLADISRLKLVKQMNVDSGSKNRLSMLKSKLEVKEILSKININPLYDGV